MSPARQRLVRDIALIMIAPFLLYLLVCLFTFSPQDPGWSHSGSVTAPLENAGGRVGAWLADVLLYLCGYVAFVLPLILGAIAWIALFGMDADGDGDADLGPALRLVGIVGFVVATTGLLTLKIGAVEDFSAGAGGILGKLVGDSLLRGFGMVGGNLFLIALLLISVTLATGLSWLAVMDRIGALAMKLPPLFRKSTQQASEWQAARAMREEREEVRKVETEKRAKREPVKIEPPPAPVVEKSERAKREQQIPLFHVADASGLPPLSLLDDPKPQPKGYDEETLETLSRQIEFKLKDFRIDAQVVGAYPGPVITRFEIEPAPGIKVSSISSLDKDIARGLSVKSVRVVDVIPGKSVIGLETPNTKREMIFLSELLRSKEYDKSTSPLTLALGKDIAGRPTVADLARMPHLLVAGTTGSGKSVAVNAMVLSLLYKASAKDLRMLMIDPKMLELSVYQGIPHLLAPVVTDMKEAANGLRWCVAEMERRYKLMSAVGVRNLAGFNKKVKDAQDAGIRWGAPALALYLCMRYLCDGLHHTVPTMVFGLGGLLVLAPLGWALTFGVGGLPALGAGGLGWASALMLWTQALGLGLYLLRARRFRSLHLFRWRDPPRWPPIRGLLALGLPIGITWLMEGGLFIATALVIGRLGTVPAAAHQIAINVASLCFMLPMALAEATTVRVGHAVGRGDRAALRRAALAGYALVLGTQLLSAGMLLAGNHAIAGLYTHDPAVIALAASLLLLAAAFQFPDGVQVLSVGALRGLKDTRVPMLLAAVAYWGIGMPLGAILGLGLGGLVPALGPRGMWMGLIAGLTVAATLLGLRLHRQLRRLPLPHPDDRRLAAGEAA